MNKRQIMQSKSLISKLSEVLGGEVDLFLEERPYLIGKSLVPILEKLSKENRERATELAIMRDEYVELLQEVIHG